MNYLTRFLVGSTGKLVATMATGETEDALEAPSNAIDTWMASGAPVDEEMTLDALLELE